MVICYHLGVKLWDHRGYHFTFPQQSIRHNYSHPCQDLVLSIFFVLAFFRAWVVVFYTFYFYDRILRVLGEHNMIRVKNMK